MSKKYILLFIIIWFVFQPFENVNAALRTKARICAVKGTVQTGNVVRNDGEMTCPLKRTMNQTECRVVNQETMIETGPDGWATIEYADGRKIRVMPNTKAVLSRNNILVQIGSSWFKVEKGEHNDFVVKTPTAIAGIRGTEFIVNVKKDGSTNIQLIEGSIEVSDAKKKSSMMLAAGMEVSIAKGSSTLNTALLKINENYKWWTDWPTLIPIAQMPGFKEEPTSSTNNGNTFFPIADNHVYAYSYSNWNKSNWGKYEQIGAGWNATGGEKRAFLKFDLSNVDPNSLEKATLKLYHNHTGGGNAVELGVYPIHGPWTEGRGTYKPASAALPGELTWNNQPKIAQYPTVYFNPGQGTNKWIEVDVTTLVKAWLEGFPNHGMVIKAGENYIGKSEAQYGFYSREYEDVDKRPQLVLNGTGGTTTSNNDGNITLPITDSQAQGTARLLTVNSNQDMVGPNETYRVNGKTDAIFRAQFRASNRTVTAVEVSNTNGLRSVWDTRPNNGLWLGGVVNQDRTMSRSDGSVNFSLGSDQNTLDFFVEDNGSIRGGKTNYRMTIFFASGEPLIMDIVPANSSNTTGSLPFYEDFSSGLVNWELQNKNAALSGEKLYWNTGNFLSAILNMELPMENIAIEFDGYCETNGLNIYLQNENAEGYIVIFGGWYNKQSGSDIGKNSQNRELVNGKVWEPNKWHHYKIVRNGNILEAFCDGRRIFERTSSARFSGKGTLKFDSYGARIGIDNIRIYNTEGQSYVNTGNSTVPQIDGEWDMTCFGDITYKFNLKLVQSGNGFYGDMVRTNGNERLAKIEGKILPNDRIEFTRSIGNWKQYYTGEINQKSGSRATSFEGMFGFKDQLNNEWYAKAINGSSSNNAVAGNWLIDQSNGYNGSMTLQRNSSGGITGNAIWNGYLKGTISGQVSGNAIEFTISYPNGDKGLYKGTLTQNGTRMINGTVKGNNGVTATWDASR